MTLNEYQRAARGFATFGGARLDYALLGLVEESGEVAGKVAKFVRKSNTSPNAIADEPGEREKLLAEVGDCLWMLANVAACLGADLDAVAEGNIAKLRGRLQRGTIVGEGDER